MNSIHRVGVTIAGFATVATVAGAFVLQGYAAAQQAAQQARQLAAAQATPFALPQIVYIRPQPTPQVQPVDQQPPVIQVVVPGGDDSGPDRD